MRQFLACALLPPLLACATVTTTPSAAFKARYSTDIQEETIDLVLATHNKAHPGCPAKRGTLELTSFSTVLARDDDVGSVMAGLTRWRVRGCPEPFEYETRTQVTRRIRDTSVDQKNYGITIEPIWEKPLKSREP